MTKEQELLQAVLNARQRAEEIDAQLSEAKEVKKNAEAALIEYMDDHDLKTFRSTTFNCMVVRKQELYVSVTEGKKEDVIRWIEEDCGRPDMIRPSIHHSTLTSFISNRLKEAEPIPQEMFKYYFKPILAITIDK